MFPLGRKIRSLAFVLVLRRIVSLLSDAEAVVIFCYLGFIS